MWFRRRARAAEWDSLLMSCPPKRGPEVQILSPPPRLNAFSHEQLKTAPVAQRIEHLTTDQKVRGSNPFGRTRGGGISSATPADLERLVFHDTALWSAGSARAVIYRRLAYGQRVPPARRAVSGETVSMADRTRVAETRRRHLDDALEVRPECG